jgi:glycosyltransferase involved in cell wall biosynthesis
MTVPAAPTPSAGGERQLWVWYQPHGLGGVETYLLNMARTARARGVDFWVAAVYSATGPLRSDYEAAGVHFLDWSAFYPAFMGQTPARPVQERLAADLAHVRPTLFAVNDCVDFALGAAPLLRRLRPFCTMLDTLHSDDPDKGYLLRRRPWLDLLDGLPGTNQRIIDRFRQTFPGATAVATRYIANGVSVSERERQPPEDELKLLYVGRLVQEPKRILELPRVLAALRTHGRPFRMTVVGDGPQREELVAALERQGLTRQVRLAGFVPPAEVLEYYFTHDVLLNLSTFEGFSLSVLEALAAGCVPVLTDLDCLDKAVFQDGVTCRLCPVEPLDGMAKVLVDLSADALRMLSARGRAVGRELTAERTAATYQEFVSFLRARRPLTPWPADARRLLSGPWNMSRDNPWIPHPHPVKQLLRRVWGGLVGAGSGRVD